MSTISSFKVDKINMMYTEINIAWKNCTNP